MSASSETREMPVKSTSGLNILPSPFSNHLFAWQQHAERRNCNNRSTSRLARRSNSYVLENEALDRRKCFATFRKHPIHRYCVTVSSRKAAPSTREPPTT